MSSPLKKYQELIDSGSIVENAMQAAVMHRLDSITQQLVRRSAQRQSLYGRVRRHIKPRLAIKGLYLWGGVGIGKTLLVDIFFNCLTVKKRRLHFHEFLREIQELLQKQAGQKNPLQKIARDISNQYLLICFDEFFVKDIADAMILTELLPALFKNGVCIVATSNIPPHELYKEGLQREHFLPAIHVLEEHTTVMHLIERHDYRRDHFEQAGIYYTPLNEKSEANMQACFSLLSAHETVSSEPIVLYQRKISVIQRSSKVVWFNFSVICTPPRSAIDYLALTEEFDTFLISNIPIISALNRANITLFVSLIDVLYDRKKRLVLSAAAPAEQLYPEGPHLFEFARTTSRLIEMQSLDYFQNRPDSVPN